MNVFKLALTEAIEEVITIMGPAGTTAVFYSDIEEEHAIVHLLEIGGTQKVNDFCILLEQYLPSEFYITTDSPTADHIHVNTGLRKPIAFDRFTHLNLFKNLFHRELTGKLYGYPQYKLTLQYAVAYYERTELSVEEFLNQLSPDAEILDQLLILDNAIITSDLQGSYLSWRKHQKIWLTTLPTGNVLFSDGTWVCLAEKNTPLNELTQLENCLWITSFERELPDMEDNLYKLIANNIEDNIAGQAASDLTSVYNKLN